jgi:hypothetical protein
MAMRGVAALAVATGCGFQSAPADLVMDGKSDQPVPDAPPDLAAIDAPVCANGHKDPGELGVDCGMACGNTCAAVFDRDDDTLAVLELNGDVSDSSGNNRNAVLVGGSYVDTAWGQGLSVPGNAAEGFTWTMYAALITHPFTIEMVLTPNNVDCYKKLFGPGMTVDDGWYYCKNFQAYPAPTIGEEFPKDQRHYLAMTSTASDHIDLYYNGVFVANTKSLAMPPSDAVFFRDDTGDNGASEHLDAVIDAVRISKIARSAAEITAIQAKLAEQP